jgi:hypothetical protein
MSTIPVMPPPASELQFGMVSEVTAVLKAHGLDLHAASLDGTPEVYAELLLALGRVLDVTPVEYGGRKVAS